MSLKRGETSISRGRGRLRHISSRKGKTDFLPDGVLGKRNNTIVTVDIMIMLLRGRFSRIQYLEHIVLILQHIEDVGIFDNTVIILKIFNQTPSFLLTKNFHYNSIVLVQCGVFYSFFEGLKEG